MFLLCASNRSLTSELNNPPPPSPPSLPFVSKCRFLLRYMESVRDRVSAEQSHVMARVKSRLEDFFQQFLSSSLQLLNTECSVQLQGSRPRLSSSAVHFTHLLLPTAADAAAECRHEVSAAARAGDVGQRGGCEAVRLMQLVNGEGACRAFDSALQSCARECAAALSCALSDIQVQNFLPQPSAAAAALALKFGPLYVLHNGFAYVA